jgi:hypothetical protein
MCVVKKKLAILLLKQCPRNARPPFLCRIGDISGRGAGSCVALRSAFSRPVDGRHLVFSPRPLPYISAIPQCHYLIFEYAMHNLMMSGRAARTSRSRVGPPAIVGPSCRTSYQRSSAPGTTCSRPGSCAP